MTRRQIGSFLFFGVLNPFSVIAIAYALSMCFCASMATQAIREIRELPSAQTTKIAASQQRHQPAFHDNVDFVSVDVQSIGTLMAQGVVAFGHYAMLVPWQEFCPNLDSVAGMIEPMFNHVDLRPMRLPMPAQTRLLMCMSANRFCSWKRCLYRDALRRGLWFQVFWLDAPGEHGCPFERMCRLYSW